MQEMEPNTKQKCADTQMTSSTVSSLASPVDSGVQMLDSESEVTSVMSASGLGCDIDAIPALDSDLVTKNIENKLTNIPDLISHELLSHKSPTNEKNEQVMTKSDIDNQNTIQDFKNLSTSVPNYFDKLNKSPLKLDKSLSDDVFEMEHPIKTDTETAQSETPDVMNISLNSYELLDYTMQNRNLNVESDQMHVSMSEEVNETLTVSSNPTNENAIPAPIAENPIVENAGEEQIVFRRQRKKKSKSDTPKKRVSFHEDILNSTKIDDIHINHGFITHEPDVSLSFFQRGFIRKPDVVKGRYSWAAEGDAPYYERTGSQREIKSDIYVQNNPRFSSTSSSSTGSISSSMDEEKEPNVHKLPKSSCLKKTKNSKKYLDTNIVQEETKRRSETNLLDSNIFGSLKNILNFSTSLPLAERGVPEGQEDLIIYSSSQDLASQKRSSFAAMSVKKSVEAVSAPVDKLTAAKANLKLTKIEGFYPNYPNNQNLPSNIILCDSNVYEHKGISYSYEYENFQKNFDKIKPTKGSTVYQRILREFNFFRRKAKDDNLEAEEDFEIVHPPAAVSQPDVQPVVEVEEPPVSTKLTSTKMDWSDNETIVSDYSESHSSRHLNSPKRKINKSNHYQIQSTPFKTMINDQNRLEMANLRPSTSKTSLINRFLRNVTMKKILDVKAQNKQRHCRKYMGLYVKGPALKGAFKRNDDLDKQLEREILVGKEKLKNHFDDIDKKQLIQFRKEIFRSCLEILLKVFPVRSAYTTNGDSKPLLVILSNTTLYIAGFKATNSYCNHFVLPYTELNTILIGPNAQTIHFSNYDKDMQCLITTGCANITSELVGKLELAVRRDINKPKLPAVKQLTMRDMINLRRAICKQTAVDKDEEYYYYSIVSIQDFVQGASDGAPLGPTKEGPLMFRINNHETRWETAYFILKLVLLLIKLEFMVILLFWGCLEPVFCICCRLLHKECLCVYFH